MKKLFFLAVIATILASCADGGTFGEPEIESLEVYKSIEYINGEAKEIPDSTLWFFEHNGHKLSVKTTGSKPVELIVKRFPAYDTDTLTLNILETTYKKVYRIEPYQIIGKEANGKKIKQDSEIVSEK